MKMKMRMGMGETHETTGSFFATAEKEGVLLDCQQLSISRYTATQAAMMASYRAMVEGRWEGWRIGKRGWERGWEYLGWGGKVAGT